MPASIRLAVKRGPGGGIRVLEGNKVRKQAGTVAQLVDGMFDLGFLRDYRAVVQFDQGQHIPGLRFRQPKAARNIARDARRCRRVALEVALAGFVDGEGLGLPNVVEQRGPAQGRFAIHQVDDMRRVLEHVVAMEGSLLVEALQGRKLRDDLPDNRHIPHQAIAGMLGAEQFLEFCRLAFFCDSGKAACKIFHGAPGALFDSESQLRRKAHRAQDAQGIFGKALPGIPDAADEPVSDVVLPSERVDQAPCRVIGDGVHGEVAPCQVFFDAVHETHRVGVPSVRVLAIGAIGGHFDGRLFDHDGDGSVLRPRFEDRGSGFAEY